ncbi:MAG: tetratricopeptide repeat protein [Verrucomicrobiales bacterium]|nr:tetratricopeptide repeat protein [Verrucomicrobiales bacterium]
MPQPAIHATAALVAALLAVGSNLPAQTPPTTDPPPPAPNDNGFKPGIADPENTGTLPPGSSGLAKIAAHAISTRDWKTARKSYLEILASAPDNALTLANLGTVEFQMGHLADARSHLESAVAKMPRLASSWTTLGLLYYQQDELNLAIAALARSLHADPTNAQTHNYLAVVAKSRGWTNAAELELQKAIDLDPGYAEAHFNLALVYLGRRPPAIELAKRHYLRAKELGSPPEPLVEKQIAGDKN